MGHLLCYIAFFAVSRTLTPSLSCIDRRIFKGTLMSEPLPMRWRLYTLCHCIILPAPHRSAQGMGLWLAGPFGPMVAAPGEVSGRTGTVR